MVIDLLIMYGQTIPQCVKVKGQSVSLYGVNAHHQNGKVSRKIGEFQDLAKTSLFIACCKIMARSTKRWQSAEKCILLYART